MSIQRYRKLPVEIEAVQWNGLNTAEIATWTDGGFKPYSSVRAELWVAANQAWLKIGVGEWVAKDSAGFYPIKEHIFAKTYEAVDDD